MQPIQRALISVSDKTGLVDFARALAARGVEILSTGGTARLLAEQGIPVTEVSDFTGFPEMMDGRVKTLHPRIHGGILGRRGLDDQVMRDHAIQPIDLVVVNLYPFEQTVARPGLRSADRDREHRHRRPDHAARGGEEPCERHRRGRCRRLRAGARGDRAEHGGVSEATRFDLAVKVFEHTARYDGAIANYLGARAETERRDRPSRAP